MPRDFGVPPDDEISVIATDTKEIMHLSQIAILFAVEYGEMRIEPELMD